MESFEEKLEDRVAGLEQGGSARVVHSRMAAVCLTALTLVRTGDEVVSSINICPETYTLFGVLLRDLGVLVNFVPGIDPAAFEAAISSRTRFIFIESAGQIVPDVYDVAMIAETAHKNKIPLVVDASSIPPVHFFPAAAGADIVIRSYSYGAGCYPRERFGAVIDSGHFDWRVSNVPIMKAADPVFGNIRWAFDLSPECAPFAFVCRFSSVMRRSLESSVLSSSVSAAIEQLESCLYEFQKRSKTAAAIAAVLKSSEKIAWIRYPGLETDPSHGPAVKQFGMYCGTTVLFGFSEGSCKSETMADTFCKALSSISIDHTGDTIKSSLSVLEEPKHTVYNVPGYSGVYPVLNQYHGAIQFTAGLEDTGIILEDVRKGLSVL